MPDHVDFHTGQRLRVFRTDDPDSSGHDATVRQVSPGMLRIDHPRLDGEYLALQPGEMVHLQLELHGRLYSFETGVRTVEDSPADLVTIDLPDAVMHTERREFYRLHCRIEPRYAARIDKQGEELQRLDVVILDISGGGAQLSSKQPIGMGEQLHLILSLDDETIEVDAEVRGGGAQLDGRISRYRVNVRFVQLPRATEQRIVGYVFREQVKLLKKGVL